jgi:hypothetical protein
MFVYIAVASAMNILELGGNVIVLISVKNALESKLLIQLTTGRSVIGDL